MTGGSICLLTEIPFVILEFLTLSFVWLIQISEPQLGPLKSLSLQFDVITLVKRCEEITERSKLNKKLFNLDKNVEISYPNSRLRCGASFASCLPLNLQRLKQFHLDGEYSDIDIHIEGHGLVARAHKIILGLWSIPFTKVWLFHFCLSSQSLYMTYGWALHDLKYASSLLNLLEEELSLCFIFVKYHMQITSCSCKCKKLVLHTPKVECKRPRSTNNT